jgi:hypothetical protein
MWGGYVVLEPLEFLVDNFNILSFWVPATVIGGALPVIVLIIAINWWARCQHLWSTGETSSDQVVMAGPTVHTDAYFLAGEITLPCDWRAIVEWPFIIFGTPVARIFPSSTTRLAPSLPR